MSWPRQLLLADALSEEAISEVNRIAMSRPASTNDQTVPDRKVRYAEARWLDRTTETDFLFARLEELFLIANRQFGFDLSGFREPVLHVSYPVDAHFTWHTDTGPGLPKSRKISMSVLLSDPRDYQGGALEFCPGGGLMDANARGLGIAFPSYM